MKDFLFKVQASIRRILFSAVFPTHCKLCHKPLILGHEKIICCQCLDSVKPASKQVCRLCGNLIKEFQIFCGHCLLKPPPYDQFIFYGHYDSPLKEIITLYKYGQMEPLKKYLARLCLQALKKNHSSLSFDFVIPVPMDKGRKRHFHHTAAIAAILGNELKTKVIIDGLLKIRSTLPQVGLTLNQRQKNLRGAFAVTRKQELRQKNILLIDDVYTTGTTVRQCSRLLKRLGNHITVITLAKTQ